MKFKLIAVVCALLGVSLLRGQQVVAPDLKPGDHVAIVGNALADRLLAFQIYYEQIAKPFEWKFTRADLHELMRRISRPTPISLAARL